MAASISRSDPLHKEAFPDPLTSLQEMQKSEDVKQVVSTYTKPSSSSGLKKRTNADMVGKVTKRMNTNISAKSTKLRNAFLSKFSYTSWSLDPACVEALPDDAASSKAREQSVLDGLVPGYLSNLIPETLRLSPSIMAVPKFTSLLLRGAFGRHAVSITAGFNFSAMSKKSDGAEGGSIATSQPTPTYLRRVNRHERSNGSSRSDGTDSRYQSTSMPSTTTAITVATEVDTTKSTKHTDDYSIRTMSDKQSHHFWRRLIGILPVAAISMLREGPRHCVANTKQQRRCKNAVKRVQDVDTLLATLTSTDLLTSNLSLLDAVHRLIEYAICGQAHRRGRISDFELLRQEEQRMSLDEKTLLRSWITSLLWSDSRSEWERSIESRTKSFLEVTPLTTSPVVEDTSTQVYRAPVTRSMTQRHSLGGTYIQKFVPYHRTPVSDTTDQALRTALERPLTQREFAKGYIYAYWFPGNFGHLKIGVTGRTPETRLEEWRKQCKHDTEIASSIYVEHVYRVEKLVHEILREHRFREIGCICGRTHKEWFKIERGDAARVIAGVAAFMSERPYVSGILRRGVAPKAVGKLSKLRVSEQPTPTTSPSRPKVSKRSSSGRKSGIPSEYELSKLFKHYEV